MTTEASPEVVDFPNESAIRRLRVNIKSLTAEARFNRQEATRSTDRAVKEELAWHRRVMIRKEARLAHLALAFIRGRDYKIVEPNAKSRPYVPALRAKINRFVSPVAFGDIARWTGEERAFVEAVVEALKE